MNVKAKLTVIVLLLHVFGGNLAFAVCSIDTINQKLLEQLETNNLDDKAFFKQVDVAINSCMMFSQQAKDEIHHKAHTTYAQYRVNKFITQTLLQQKSLPTIRQMVTMLTAMNPPINKDDKKLWEDKLTELYGSIPYDYFFSKQLADITHKLGMDETYALTQRRIKACGEQVGPIQMIGTEEAMKLSQDMMMIVSQPDLKARILEYQLESGELASILVFLKPKAPDETQLILTEEQLDRQRKIEEETGSSYSEYLDLFQGFSVMGSLNMDSNGQFQLKSGYEVGIPIVEDRKVQFNLITGQYIRMTGHQEGMNMDALSIHQTSGSFEGGAEVKVSSPEIGGDLSVKFITGPEIMLHGNGARVSPSGFLILRLSR
jgi:hypothetical protein